MRTVVALVMLVVVLGVFAKACGSSQPEYHLTPAQCAAYVQQGHDAAEC